MSVNRLSWAVVVIVVVVVGALVVRTLRQDTRIRTEEQRSSQAARAVSPATGTQAAEPQQPNPAPRVAEPGERRLGSVHRAKAVLKSKGYYDGPVDNNFDRTVAEALKKFQQDAGMRPTGWLDQKTYAALGIEVQGHRP